MTEAHVPARPRRSDQVLERRLSANEALLLTPEGEAALVLNAVATAIWQLADGERTSAEIASYICEHFDDVPPEQVLADVERLLEELARAGVLER